MDILVKHNIVKKDKFIIDAGMHSTKILDVRYSAKNVNIRKTMSFENLLNEKNGEYNFNDLARRADELTYGNGRQNIVISLPQHLTESRIVSIKNKKETEISKLIRRDFMTFGRVTPITHIVDYAFLGNRDEDGDTVGYYLISAVKKSIVNDLISSFADRKMRITQVVSGAYNRICLAELFFNDYENLNRIMLDIGTKSSRILALADGIPVYLRDIDIGFQDYIDSISQSQTKAGVTEIKNALNELGEMSGLDIELYSKYFHSLDKDIYKNCIEEVDRKIMRETGRIIDLFASKDARISKIYLTGHILSGFAEKMERNFSIDAEFVRFKDWEEKAGKGYTLTIDEAGMNESFSNAVGLAISQMV